VNSYVFKGAYFDLMDAIERIKSLTDKVLDEKDLDIDEANWLNSLTHHEHIFYLVAGADRIRQKYFNSSIELCSIVNAKSGRCSEDCRFCAQSAHYRTGVQTYPLLGEEKVIRSAEEAVATGVKRFSIVISGRRISPGSDLERICSMIEKISGLERILPCASLGVLSSDTAQSLKSAGLIRYHHNLETAQGYFHYVCTTHSYEERIATIRLAQEFGFELCSGGIWGLGETPEQRLELAFSLKDLRVDSVAINILTPIKGTPMYNQVPMPPLEIIKTIAIYRHILPDQEIRVCGGRTKNLRSLQPLIYLAGCNGVMTGNYLTTKGRNPEEDITEIRDLGLTISS